MPVAGGLKLKLESGTRDDRRVRFAQVTLDRGASDESRLVTDARGRLSYRLPEGEYRVRVLSGEEARFAVSDRRWTTVHLPLR